MSSNTTTEFFTQLQNYRTSNKTIEFYDEYAKDYDNALVDVGYEKITEYEY